MTDGRKIAERSFRQRLDLVRHLARRDFILRYHGSALGLLWYLMLPLTQLGVLVLLFQHVVPLGIEAYPAFILSALLPWTWFSASVGEAGSLFINNRDLVRQPRFRPGTLMIVNTLARLFGYLASLPILVGVLVLYGRPLTPALLGLPLLVLIQGFLILGLGLTVATLNVYYRDVQHIVTALLSLLFFMTPVFYRSQQVTDQFKVVYDYNPLVGLTEAYRAVFFYGRAPDPHALVFASVVSASVCLLGYAVYRRKEHDIVDTI